MSETKSLLEFRNPPPPRRGYGRDYDAIIAALRERPGAWALIASGLRGKGSYSFIRRRLVDGGCEVTSRTNSEGLDIYARWPSDG